MSRWTIDVGNTSVGVGRWEGETVAVARHADPVAAAAGLEGEIAVISVAPRRLDALLAALDRARARARVLSGAPLPLADPRLLETAGADRLANAAALLPGPGIAIDAGTALTVDVVDGAGVYRGGFIAAGPALLARALAAHTEQLPPVAGEPHPIEPGGETRAALGAGVWGMVVGGADRLVDAALRRLELPRGAVRIVATGGWGRAFARDSAHADLAWDEGLVHRGIRRWAGAAG